MNEYYVKVIKKYRSQCMQASNTQVKKIIMVKIAHTCITIVEVFFMCQNNMKNYLYESHPAQHLPH